MAISVSRNWPALFLSLMVTLTAAIPLAHLTIPHLKRRITLNKLTAPDPADRQRALNLVAQQAAADPRVLHTTIARLDVPDRANFLQIVEALDLAGCWKRPNVPLHHWLRWLTILSSDPSPEARILAAQLTADLSDLADDPAVLNLLSGGLSDTEPDVRYNALIAAAELSSSTLNPTPYHQMILTATQDPQPQLARQAWIFVGLARPPNTPIPDWPTADPQVAGPMLWAWIQTHPDDPQPAVNAALDPAADPAVRALAVYALSFTPHPLAQQTLRQIAANVLENLDPTNQLLAWRAIVGMSLNPDDPHDPAWETLTRLSLLKPWGNESPNASHGIQPDQYLQFAQPLVLSAVYRLAGAAPSPHTPAAQVIAHLPQYIEATPNDQQSFANPRLYLLATLEGLPPGRYIIDLPRDLPQTVRLAAAAVMANPQPRDLAPLFESPRATLRDLACVIAADRLTGDQQSELIISLLNNFNDNAKTSGAILAGLTGLQPKLLAKKTRDEDQWWVKQFLLLGLWMQEHPAPHGANLHDLAPGLLVRSDVPTSSVLLALMHKNQPLAWDVLFNPRGEDRLGLAEWFDQARWWTVAKRYLPPNAPPFWIWADPQLEQFQIDILRNHYLLHRRTPQQSKKRLPSAAR